MPALFMQGPTRFHIAASRKDEALSLLQLHYDRVIPPDQREDEDHLAPLCCLEEGLFIFKWEASPVCDGDITDIRFSGEVIDQQDEALAAIACCVTAGSFLTVVIEHEGQLGFSIEQWLFDGARMHILESDPIFAELPERNPDRKSVPQLLVGLQMGLSLSLQYLLALLARDPELAGAFEQQFLLECLVAETHTGQGVSREGQGRYLLGALSSTINHLLEAADAGD